jgi:hypothetical protein
MDVCVCVCVCMYVCVFEHNSGTPGVISTKLGTYIAICMYKNLRYILHIYILSPKHQSPREDDVEGLHGIPPQVVNRNRGNTYAHRYPSNSNIRPFLFRYVNLPLQLRCHITVKYLNFYVSVSAEFGDR